MQGQELRGGVDVLRRLGALDAELAEALARDDGVVGEDAHAEADGASRDELPDAAEAEHAEHLVRELDAAPLRALPAAVLQRRVRLRDVARERDEQADGVLGRRDDVRVRCIRDDDPLTGGGVDVDVVDPDPGAADHLQPRRPSDQIRGQLGGRADDDRVVAVDDRREVGIAVLVDLEAAPEQLDARRGDLLPHQNPHRAHPTNGSITAFSKAMILHFG